MVKHIIVVLLLSSTRFLSFLFFFLNFLVFCLLKILQSSFEFCFFKIQDFFKYTHLTIMKTEKFSKSQ